MYRTKASNIQKMAHILLEKYQGQVPDDFDELMKLPGIGRKTANVMMSVGFGQPGLGSTPMSTGSATDWDWWKRRRRTKRNWP